MPNVLRFIVGAFPMFIGYALFGMLLFSEDTERVILCLNKDKLLVCRPQSSNCHTVQSYERR
jgi:hypothetical protein